MTRAHSPLQIHSSIDNSGSITKTNTPLNALTYDIDNSFNC